MMKLTSQTPQRPVFLSDFILRTCHVISKQFNIYDFRLIVCFRTGTKPTNRCDPGNRAPMPTYLASREASEGWISKILLINYISSRGIMINQQTFKQSVI